MGYLYDKRCLMDSMVHYYYIKKTKLEDLTSPKNSARVVQKIIDSGKFIMSQQFYQGIIHHTLGSLVQGDKFKFKKAYIVLQP